MKKRNFRRKKQFSIALQKIYKDFLFTIKDSYKNKDYLNSLAYDFLKEKYLVKLKVGQVVEQ